MVKKAQSHQQIIDAAMDLAAERGWPAVTLADVAVRVGLPLAEVYGHFPSRNAILRGLMQHIDHLMLEGEVESGASVRDRLFDVAMRRFEALLPYRPALRAIVKDSGDPVSLARGVCRFGHSMALLLEAAGVSSSGVGGLARVGGMAAVYLSAMRVWLDDETGELSRTMAALDKALRRAGTIVAMMERRCSPARPPHVAETSQEA